MSCPSIAGSIALVLLLVCWASPAVCQETTRAPNTSSPRLALLPPEPVPLPALESGVVGDQLTLTHIEELAQSFHPALRAAAGQLQAARGNWLQVGLKPNPEIGYSGAEIGNDGSAGQQGGYLSQEFVTANKLGLSRGVAAREVAAAEQRLERIRLQVVTTARIGYVEALAAERAVALARQLNEIAGQAVHVSELRLKALAIPRSSLLQSQIERESAALLEQQSTQRREAAWRRLGAAVGFEHDQRHELEDIFTQPLPEYEWDATRERLLSNSPELAELRFDVERAQLAVERAAAGRVPNVNMQAGAAFDDAANDTIANVQVSIPLPVFNRNQGAIAQACGELAAARAALQERELVLAQRLAAALRDYETARQRVVRYAGTILPTARETLDITSQGYQQGELEYLQVLSVQQMYAQANVAYLQDLETAWKRWAEIEGLLVGTVPDGTE